MRSCQNMCTKKKRTNHDMRIKNVYSTGSMYLKRVPIRKVKVRLNLSKS